MADRMNEILSQKKETDKKARYLMLYFSRGYVSQMRGDTFVDQMNQRTDIEQVASYFTDGSRKKAYQATIATLSEHQDLDLIFACSTDIALGALDALREKNLVGKIMINGWGGGSSELTAIQNQELDMTVMRLNDDNGVAMAEAIRLDMEGKASQIPHIYSGDIRLIEKGVTETELKALQKQAFRYSD